MGGSSFVVRGLWGGGRGGRGGRLEERATSSASFGEMYVSCGGEIERVNYYHHHYYYYYYYYCALGYLEAFLKKCIFAFLLFLVEIDRNWMLSASKIHDARWIM